MIRSVCIALAGCTIAGALASASLHASENVTPTAIASPAPFAHEASDLVPDERLRFGVLDNGLRYVVMRNETPKNAAALRMVIDTGSLNETDAQQGLAHFLEHMAFNGSVNVPEGEMVKRLERLGLAFGADTNASTGFEQTTYKLNLPSVDKAVLDEAFFLMRETASNLLLGEDAIERERGVIASEKLARDTVRFRSYMALQNFLQEGSTRTLRSPIGLDETIATMPRSEFEAYYRAYYRPENTTVVFVGDLDPTEAIARIEDTFADWQPVGEGLAPRTIVPASLTPNRTGVHRDTSIPTSMTIAGLRPYTKEPDTADLRRTRLVEAIGKSIMNRRFAQMIERGDADFLSATASTYRRTDTVDGVALTVRFAPEKWREAMVDGDLAIRRALQFGFTPAELEEVLESYRRNYQNQTDAANTRPSYDARNRGLVDALVSRLARERVLTSPASEQAMFEAVAPTITLEEVSAAFRADWSAYQEPVIFLSGDVRVEDYETQLSAALADARAVEPSPLEASEALAFPYTDFGTPGAIASREYIDDIDTHVVTFENGVQLSVKETPFEGERIQVKIDVGDGFMSMPRDSEGLRRLGLNLLDDGGVEGFYNDELRRIFAGKSVSSRFRTRVDDDAFALEGATNPDDLSDYLNLATAKITAPVFRESNAKRHFDVIRAWYPRHDGTVGGVVARELPRLVRSGDKRFGFDGLDDFLTPELDEITEWIAPQLANGPIEVVMVGDISPDAAIAEVARTLGALDARQPVSPQGASVRPVRFPAGNEAPYIFYHRDNDDQALVRVYWPAPGADDPEDGLRMRVLRSLFRNRLTAVLREELGATYSPGVGRFLNPLYSDYGYLLAHVITSPAQAEQVRTSVLEVATAMASEPIAEDEFRRALRPLIEDVSSSLENNGYWMNVLGDAGEDGYNVRTHRAREAIYTAMTVADIEELARQVLQNQNAISAFILPNPDAERLSKK